MEITLVDYSKSRLRQGSSGNRVPAHEGIIALVLVGALAVNRDQL
jgi:hypothetical protein